jgi:hypothetical protein
MNYSSFPIFRLWRKPKITFHIPRNSYLPKTFTGQKRLLGGSAIPLMIIYFQEILFCKELRARQLTFCEKKIEAFFLF